MVTGVPRAVIRCERIESRPAQWAAVVKKSLIQIGPVILHSANPRYLDIEAKKTDQFQIAGIIRWIVERAL